MSSKLHPDGKLNPSLTVSNDSNNQHIFDVVESYQAQRRTFIKGTLGVSALALTGGVSLNALAHSGSANGNVHAGSHVPVDPEIGFTSVPPNIAPMVDAVTVPAGYKAEVLVAWGDSLTQAPHWDVTKPMDEATQLRCYGGHTDGMHFFPNNLFGKTVHGNRSGLLVSNSECGCTFCKLCNDHYYFRHGARTTSRPRCECVGNFKLQRQKSWRSMAGES